ncbi:MAG: hypothetical protein A2070_14625 [Bdellovibrionales bacterium GWC1_52_8]|nr:MAG: hypothetical protein A2Z97_12605 [Bdellovibrionales bacterium GWB1_52_6]OFZ04163.1 MAG: hypothetical protein A2X97_15305 [Bdellovibrionales bacterium GWA1_52_35]OFZ33284.1 MAG: hypothetical protein A2070_14625 [Bdellovibrionales bacterium GWC1_52_8]
MSQKFAANGLAEGSDEISLQMLLNRRDDRGFGVIADELIHGGAVFEEKNGRNPPDMEPRRRVRVFINIHFEDFHPAGELIGDFGNRRTEHPAGAAPLSPEVNDDQLLGLEHLGLEIGVSCGEYVL